MFCRIILCLGFLLVLLASQEAIAQQAQPAASDNCGRLLPATLPLLTDGERVVTRTAFERGGAALAAGRFEEAISLLESASQMGRDPVSMLNFASALWRASETTRREEYSGRLGLVLQCLRAVCLGPARQGRAAASQAVCEATAGYETLLAAWQVVSHQPTAAVFSTAPLVVSSSAQMRGAAGRSAAPVPPSSPRGTGAPVSRRSTLVRVGPLAAVTLGGALLATGAVLGLAVYGPAASSLEDANSGAPGGWRVEDQATARWSGPTSVALMVTGGIVAAAGVVWHALRSPIDQHPSPIRATANGLAINF